MSVLQQYMHHPAWTRGFQDHIQGLKRENNPFFMATGGIPYQAWDQGWCSAEKERNHVEVIDPLEVGDILDTGVEQVQIIGLYGLE